MTCRFSLSWPDFDAVVAALNMADVAVRVICDIGVIRLEKYLEQGDLCVNFRNSRYWIL